MMEKMTIKIMTGLLMASLVGVILVGCGNTSVSDSKPDSDRIQSSSSVTSEVIADAMTIESLNDVEFFCMRVKDDYVLLPGRCEWVYTLPGGDYPELEDGKIAKVVADVDIYEGGEAGYMGNYFIKDLKSQEVVTYTDVDHHIYIPNALDNTFDFSNHILSYQAGEKWYFIVINRSYVEVYEDGMPFMEYQHGDLDDLLAPFFEEIM